MGAMQKHPVERFDPLLRDLLAFELVDAEDGDHWVLTPEVQHRLTALLATQVPARAAVLHIGYACAGCHASGITRLFEGRHLCDACIEQELEERRQPVTGPLVEAGGMPAQAPAPSPGGGAGPADVGERRLISRYRASIGVTPTA